MKRLPQQGSASIEIEAAIVAVWNLVADVTRMGTWSPECHHVEWTGAATNPEVGAEFHGYNRAGTIEWDMPCVVTECEPGRLFAFAVPPGSPQATHWRFELEPTATGTKLTESFDAPLINLAGSVANYEGRFEMMLNGAEATLANIKAAAETEL